MLSKLVGAANIPKARPEIWKDSHKLNKRKREKRTQNSQKTLEQLSRNSHLNKERIKSPLEVLLVSLEATIKSWGDLQSIQLQKKAWGYMTRLKFITTELIPSPYTSMALLIHSVTWSVLGNTDWQNYLSWKGPLKVI